MWTYFRCVDESRNRSISASLFSMIAFNSSISVSKFGTVFSHIAWKETSITLLQKYFASREPNLYFPRELVYISQDWLALFRALQCRHRFRNQTLRFRLHLGFGYLLDVRNMVMKEGRIFSSNKKNGDWQYLEFKACRLPRLKRCELNQNWVIYIEAINQVQVHDYS